jgi:hypothetical protein
MAPTTWECCIAGLSWLDATLGLGVQRLARRFFGDMYRCYADFVRCLRWMERVLLGFWRDIRFCTVGRGHVRVGRLARR